MKVKMLEVFQGTEVRGKLIHDDIEVTIFQIGDEMEVTQELGEWLIEHRKAELITSAYKPEPIIEKAEPLMTSKRGQHAKN